MLRIVCSSSTSDPDLGARNVVLGSTRRTSVMQGNVLEAKQVLAVFNAFWDSNQTAFLSVSLLGLSNSDKNVASTHV